MIYIIYCAVAVVAFLSSINDFYRGNKTPHVDEALTIIWMGLILSAFVIAGWKSGFIALFGFFVIGGLCRPLAARVVTFILKARK